LVSQDDALTILQTAIDTADLDGALDGDVEYTLFAPTDEALANVIATVDGVCENGFTADDLLSSELLDDILLYHVVSGTVLADDVVALDGQTIATLLDDLGTDLDDPGLTVGVNGDVTLTDALPQAVTVIETDLEASNGVVHLIDGVLVPVEADALVALCPAE
ncbi:MAG: hypothetical protein GVY27_03495, partial [Deinococcus-Thermus bacterium]|nr:hypothetical protein [Deinococcota bacterium]